MACIGKIRGSLAMACGTPAPAFNRIQGAKLLNESDIASFTVSPQGEAIITRVAGSVGYDVTTINNAFTLSVGMKSQDITPGAYDVTVTFKNFVEAESGGLLSSPYPRGAVGSFARSELVIAVDHGGGQYRIYGLGAPLVCLEYNMDSTADGYMTATYGVEDWQVGTTVHWITVATYNGLSTPAAAPGT